MTAQSPTKSRRLFFFTLLLFAICSAFWIFIYAAHPDFVRGYPDGLRYMQIAKSIYNRHDISIYSMPVGYQKILYPLFLSPLYAIRDSSLRIRAILAWNAVLMNSALFPAYLLGRRLAKNQTAAVLALLYLAFLPLHRYIGIYNAECLFLPIGLWNIYLIVRVFQENDFRKKCLLSLCAGAFTYFSYLTKEIAVSFLLTFVALECYQWFVDNPRRPKNLLPTLYFAAGFAALFVLFKLILFRGMGNSYAWQVGFAQIATPYRFFYMLYSFAISGLCLLVGLFVFPLLYPLFRFKNILGRDDGDTRKKTYLFLILCILVNLAIVAYTICVREDLGRLTPRIQSRYFIPLFFPLVLIFLDLVLDKPRRLTKPGEPQGSRYHAKWAISGALVLFCFAWWWEAPTEVGDILHYANVLGRIWFQDIKEGAAAYTYNGGMILIKCALAVFLALGLYALRFSKGKQASVFFAAVMLLVNVANDTSLTQSDLTRAGRLQPREEAALAEVDQKLQERGGG